VSPFERRADRIRATRQHFLWEDRIPLGHITILAGGPSKGKSTLGYLAAKEADVPTIFVTAEEVDKTVWRPRIQAAGMDLRKAFHHPEVMFSKRPQDLDALRELIELYEAKLVVVDPLSNHLRGASIHHDESVRATFEPYEAMTRELEVALLLQVHVLRSISKNMHPLSAVPVGVASLAKAVYLFADDPTIGADPNIRILANAGKFNFGEMPPSARFEFTTRKVRVLDEQTGITELHPYGVWVPRGLVNISARALLVTLRPEDKERKADVAAHVLLKLLKDGPRPVGEIRNAIADRDPPISFRTAERVAEEIGILAEDDPTDKRRKIWRLPPEVLATLEEASSDSEIQIEEVDIPDTLPEDWGSGDDKDGGESDGEDDT
jgi:hypothetical protein